MPIIFLTAYSDEKVLERIIPYSLDVISSNHSPMMICELHSDCRLVESSTFLITHFSPYRCEYVPRFQKKTKEHSRHTHFLSPMLKMGEISPIRAPFSFMI